MSATDPQADDAATESSLLFHLRELRSRLIRIVAVTVLLLLALLPFANEIYLFFSRPLTALLPAGSSMIATEVASPFFAPFKLTSVVALLLAMPYLLYQLWSFIAPGMYRHEKRFALPLLLASILLFYGGIAFGYFLVLPTLFAFFTSTAPQGVALMTDINQYLDFVLKFLFSFGITFEVPVATVLLIRAGIVSAAALADKRPHVIVLCFVIGMVLTPPDVFSQTMLAVPMWLLFEAGLLCGRLLTPPAEPVKTEVTTQAPH